MQLEFFGAAGEVTGEIGAATALRDAFLGQDVSAELSRPGLCLDLGSPADVRG